MYPSDSHCCLDAHSSTLAAPFLVAGDRHDTEEPGVALEKGQAIPDQLLNQTGEEGTISSGHLSHTDCGQQGGLRPVMPRSSHLWGLVLQKDPIKYTGVRGTSLAVAQDVGSSALQPLCSKQRPTTPERAAPVPKLRATTAPSPNSSG